MSTAVISPTEDHTPRIEYHADDYGLFPRQSRRILDCHTSGNLNGISIIPNSPCLAEGMAELLPYRQHIAVTVHLNFFEGQSLCSRNDIPALTDGNGNLCCSFGALLLHSYLPGRRTYRSQLKQEIRAQIRAVAAHLPEDEPLRIDSHAHYHMIPVVFDALMDVIREDGLKVSYIRIPREYLRLYLPHFRQLKDISPLNFVKVFILNLLACRNTHQYKHILHTMEQKLFMGVLLSGRMYRENVAPCLPDALALAQKKGWNLELLAHPGAVLEPEDIARLTNRSDIHFLTSSFREREASMYQLDAASGKNRSAEDSFALPY